MTVAVIGNFRIPADRMEEARPLMRKVMEATRAEEGCIQYNFAECVIDPGLIRVSELWETREQLAAHLKTPHMAVWAEERAGLGLTGRDISVHDISSSEQL